MERTAGRLGEVWKHLVLAEVVRAERPERYAESHAGAAVHPLPGGGEQRYGIRRAAAAFGRPSAYLDVVRPFLAADALPGSAVVALSIAPDTDALLCDTDPAATADLRAWLARSDVTGARVVTADGASALRPWLARGRALVHVDPDDPEDDLGASVSGIDLAAELVDAGHGLVWWYGYDHPDDRDWAITALDRPDLWAGDLLVTTADGEVEEDGELAVATTPGTGFGVLVAGVDPALGRRLEALGDALVAAYDGAPLPDGRPGALDLLVDVS